MKQVRNDLRFIKKSSREKGPHAKFYSRLRGKLSMRQGLLEGRLDPISPSYPPVELLRVPGVYGDRGLFFYKHKHLFEHPRPHKGHWICDLSRITPADQNDRKLNKLLIKWNSLQKKGVTVRILFT